MGEIPVSKKLSGEITLEKESSRNKLLPRRGNVFPDNLVFLAGASSLRRTAQNPATPSLGEYVKCRGRRAVSTARAQPSCEICPHHNRPCRPAIGGLASCWPNRFVAGGAPAAAARTQWDVRGPLYITGAHSVRLFARAPPILDHWASTQA